MNTKYSVKYTPLFLMSLGISNALIMVLVAVMRLFTDRGILLFGLQPEVSLSLVEPYGKVVWELLLVIYFVKKIINNRDQLDATILGMWTFVIIEVQVIYYVSNNYYGLVIDVMSEFAGTAAYVAYYTGTHVFKYALIFMSFIFAYYMMGVLLHDRILLVGAIVMAALYGLCYGLQRMPTVTLPGGREIGIVIPAALYHLTQTVIMIATGCYLNKYYRAADVPVQKQEETMVKTKEESHE